MHLLRHLHLHHTQCHPLMIQKSPQSLCHLFSSLHVRTQPLLPQLMSLRQLMSLCQMLSRQLMPHHKRLCSTPHSSCIIDHVSIVFGWMQVWSAVLTICSAGPITMLMQTVLEMNYGYALRWNT